MGKNKTVVLTMMMMKHEFNKRQVADFNAEKKYFVTAYHHLS
jgi:hypothetical protein